ncbi:Glyco_trans_2-like domain-containing protein [Vibrio chagasii]|nr:Glyco_trans_2-like domain-containing protein [Vibrio chagasii]
MKISVVIAMMNEDENFQELNERVLCSLGNLCRERACTAEVLYIDDGSSDHTWEQVLSAISALQSIEIHGIKLSRNFGQQAAVLAGLERASGDYIFVLDGDLQDPPELMVDMFNQLTSCDVDVVYGKRTSRRGESIMKRATSYLFYRAFNAANSSSAPCDVGDFRIMSRRALNAFLMYDHKSRYNRGIMADVGFKQSCLDFSRPVRRSGYTKYNFGKLFDLGFSAITSFGDRLFYPFIGFGVVMSMIGFLCVLFSISGVISGAFSLQFVHGYFFLGTGLVQLLLGLLGTVVLRIGKDVRSDPIYIVESEVGSDD